MGRNCTLSQKIFPCSPGVASSNTRPSVHAAWANAITANAPTPGRARRAQQYAPTPAEVAADARYGRRWRAAAVESIARGRESRRIRYQGAHPHARNTTVFYRILKRTSHAESTESAENIHSAGSV